jgi:hypothetical protein
MPSSLHRLLCGLAVLSLLCIGTFAFAADSTPPTPADPLTATIHMDDAERFARLYASTHGKPTAAQLQAEYLDNASYGVAVFTPYRILNAANLATNVAAHPDSYQHAIDRCLPHLQQYNADLRSIYLALHGLFPDRPLPQIYIVFGAGNSGGTSGTNAQVLGLEVICEVSGDTSEGLRSTLRKFFAHETVHTLQSEPSGADNSPLLADALTEGGADFIASLVTGETPDPQRAAWASQREANLWSQFRKDMVTTEPSTARDSPQAAQQASRRWYANYKIAPVGWPSEVGYWVGMRIWQCYFDAAPDKHQAVRDVLNWNDPDLVLRISGYAGGPCAKEK